MHRRFPFFVLISIVLVGLLMFGGQSRQQDAWTQGYLTGLAAAGGQDGSALPYALAVQNQRSGLGGFGVVFAFGLLAMLFFVVMRGVCYWMWQSSGGSDGEEPFHPWSGCGASRSEAQATQQAKPPRPPMPAEPV